MVNKHYTAKFCFGLFTLDVFSDDRDNGKHKHFITVYLFNTFRVIHICYRTGKDSVGQDIYSGSITKYSIWSTLWRTCVFAPLDKVFQWIAYSWLNLSIMSPFADGHTIKIKKDCNDFSDHIPPKHEHKDLAFSTDTYSKSVSGTTIELTLDGKEHEEFKEYYHI